MARQALYLIPQIATEQQRDQYSQGRARAGEDERPIGRQSVTTTPSTGLMRQDNGNVCSCGKVCKNAKGVNIHRAKMGCPPVVNLVQRTRELDETSEGPNPDEHHSVRNLHAPGNQETSSTQRVNPSQSSENTKCKIKWPNRNETEKWRSLDDQLANILDVTMKGDIDTKLRTMTTVIYNLSKDQFGVKQPRCRNDQPETQSRRQITITNIRKDIKNLTKQFKRAQEHEKPALAELRALNRGKLRCLRRAENHRRHRKERKRKRARFTSNPFQYVSRMLGASGVEI